MTNSMTAFANSEMDFENLTINCELRSVNHRYCDITLKLPERFRYAEADIRHAISDKLKRGKIECNLSFKKHSQAQQKLSIDIDAVSALLSTTGSIAQLMDQPRPFRLWKYSHFLEYKLRSKATKPLY
ncbi:YicC/YloC family endoribonuclease [Methyloprofundus sp.]|uniref:YicC/YloC family endoribonuclease n=1 Tax=Methyloprofundus sp. TaxID=2020875 RepID=UPI003D134D98